MTKTRIGLFANSGWNFLNFRRELIENLRETGYEVHLIAPDYLEEIARLGEVHPLDMTPAGMNFVAESLVIRRLARLLKSLNLHCLLTFTIKPNLYGSLAASQRTKVICNITGLGELFHERHGLRVKIARSVYKHALSRCSVAFVQNDEDARFLSEERFLPEGKIRRVPGSGVNISRFAPQNPVLNSGGGEHGGRTHFLFVGRFRKDKGFMEFVNAAESLLRRGADARFTMVGATEPGRKFSITQADIARIRDTGQINLIDFQEDIRPCIASADCVVLPSYREGLSRSLLEAASMAKPIITTDVPGCRDAVIPEATGFLCAPKCHESLASAMETFHRLGLRDKQSMGRAGRNFVIENFSVERVVDIYARQIEQLLGRQPQARLSRSIGVTDVQTPKAVNTDY